MTGFALHGADSRVYYSDPERYIIEAAWAGSKWITTPIARDLEAPRITEDGVMVSFAVNGSASRVYYFDEKNYVCELAWTSSGWVVNNVAELLRAPQSGNSGALSGFALGGSASRVYYQDASGYVNELAWTGSHWTANAIAKNAGAPPAAAGGSLASFEVAGNAPRVYYCDEELRLTELAWTSGHWAVNTIAGTASAPAVHPGGHITGFAAGGSDSRVYYPDSEGYITELASFEGTWWVEDPIARKVPGLRMTVDGSGMTSFAV